MTILSRRRCGRRLTIDIDGAIGVDGVSFSVAAGESLPCRRFRLWQVADGVGRCLVSCLCCIKLYVAPHARSSRARLAAVAEDLRVRAARSHHLPEANRFARSLGDSRLSYLLRPIPHLRVSARGTHEGEENVCRVGSRMPAAGPPPPPLGHFFLYFCDFFVFFLVFFLFFFFILVFYWGFLLSL